MRVSRQNYEKELIKLNMNISDMGRLVIDSVQEVEDVIKANDHKAARAILDSEPEVRELARKIENRCIKLIMREQPVATDLRVISSALKLVTDLERMQRQAGEIAEISLEISDEDFTTAPVLNQMSEVTFDITVDAVNAYMHNDMDLIEKVVETDDKIDSFYDRARVEIVEEIKNETISAEEAVNLLLQAKYLEKIGDHAENIVNWVNYAITGDQLKNH